MMITTTVSDGDRVLITSRSGFNLPSDLTAPACCPSSSALSHLSDIWANDARTLDRVGVLRNWPALAGAIAKLLDAER